MKPKFIPGKLVMTSGVDAHYQSDPSMAFFLGQCFAKHISGDWGDVPEEDAKANEEALVYGTRVMSVYTYEAQHLTVWIITEADRSVTTILLPVEY